MRRHYEPRAERVKQSQFAAGGQEGTRGGKVIRAGDTGPKRAKQSQFRQGGAKSKYRVEKEL